MLRILDLFSGIGGFSLGLERTGAFETVAFCEMDPYCQRVLRSRWPGVFIFDDVRTLTAERLFQNMHGGLPDVICGGFPCQDISTAGSGDGIDGEQSGLWREYARLVGEIRPQFVIVENSPRLVQRGLGRVLGDLAAIRYDAEWSVLSACRVGAPHTRERLFIVAYPNMDGLKAGRAEGSRDDATPYRRRVSPGYLQAAALAISRARGGAFASEPDVARVADGVPDRVDRNHALGNAVLPQLTEVIGRAIMGVSHAA